MPVTTSYPGVYIQEDASPSISVSHAATAVPVFVGKFFPASGKTLTAGVCIRVSSWLDFNSKFSVLGVVSVAILSAGPTASTKPEDPKPEAGGQDEPTTYTYTETITVEKNPAFDIQQYFMNGGGACYILPVLDFTNVTELAGLPAAIEKESDITLLVGVYASTADRDNLYKNLNPLLTGSSGYFLIADSTDGITRPSTQADQTAAYYPTLTTSYVYPRPADSAIVVTGYVDAAHALDTVKDLSSLQTANPDEYQKISTAIDSNLAASVILQPGSSMAGIYCSNDARRGVWKAPANVAVSGVTGVTRLMSDDNYGQCNDAGINAIGVFSDRGVIVWGARTCSGTSTNSDLSWRYVSVRRLFNSAEADIKKAMQNFVFEPNNQPTWEKVRSAIDNYLYDLWTQKALVGATSKEAYNVQIGLNVTMSADQIAQGQMIVTVGMAAVRPAEFIILQFTQNMAS